MTLSHPQAPTATAAGDPLAITHDGGVAVVTLNRPQTRNSLSDAMLNALAAALAELRESKAVRAVVLTAAGPVFCAGHDLKEMTAARTQADGGRAYFADVMRRCAAVMQAIVALPQPVIAAAQGTATAAGCQLVATCDLAVAASHAKFCTPGVNIGLFCTTPMVALSRAVGAKPALEMLLLGDLIDAETARAWGLVNRVVAPEAVLPTAMEMAKRIAAKSAYAVRVGKAAFHRERTLPLAEAYADAAAVMTENLLAHDAAEGICAFIDKRTPTWKDC